MSCLTSTGPTWCETVDRHAVKRWPSLREIRNQGCIDLFQFQSGGHDLQTFARVLQKQLEGVGIGVTCVSARAALEREALPKESTDVRSQSSHGAAPVRCASLRSAMSRISSGTASRYQ